MSLLNTSGEVKVSRAVVTRHAEVAFSTLCERARDVLLWGQEGAMGQTLTNIPQHQPAVLSQLAPLVEEHRFEGGAG